MRTASPAAGRPPARLVDRLRVALAGTAAVSVLVLAIGVWLGQSWIEETVLRRSLAQEMDFMLEHGALPEDINTRGLALQFFRPALSKQWRVPVELRKLPPGSHHDVAIGDRSFEVLVRDLGPDDRAYLVADIEDVERREELILLGLVLSVLFSSALGVLASQRIARASLQPLDELVARIAAFDPEQRGQRIDLNSHQPDLEPVARVLNAHMAALDAVVERERAFAAAASHELRTPLAVIASATELHAANPQAADVACERSRRAVRSAVEVLDALLALSQTRALPAPQALAMDQLLPELAGAYEDELRRSGARIGWQLQPGVTWSGSRGVAAVIFGNLLRNAAQAAPGSEIRITLSPGRLEVRDQGPGLDPAIAARAFEPGVSGRAGGSGMGLYVARTLARRCGGDLSLEPVAGGGACAVWMFSPHTAPVP